MHRSPVIRSAFAALLVAPTACGGARAPVGASLPTTEVGAFVVRLGADTVAIEEFTRSQEQLQGRQVVRTPRTSLREYVATLRPDGSMERFEMTVRNEPGGPAVSEATVEFGTDSATVRSTRDGEEQTRRVAAPRGSIPFLGYSVAIYEAVFTQMRNAETEQFSAATVPFAGSTAFPLEMEARGTDTILVQNLAGENRARVDRDGRLLVWDGRGSTLDLIADRTVAVDIDRLAREFRARDDAGRGLGSLSPRDSVEARVGDATVSVAYGRPAARGREIFGHVVPWNQVWRTGANQATVLRTDRDLSIGGTPVPAGSYSLFTIPSPDGWQLIINRQSGQPGTEHDTAQDLARVPMQSRSLPEHVETFTIAIEETGEAAAELRMEWGDTGATVPIATP